MKVFEHEGQGSATCHTQHAPLFPSPAMGPCGKERTTGLFFFFRRGGGGVGGQISPERMESFLFPVLCCSMVKALPVQGIRRQVKTVLRYTVAASDAEGENQLNVFPLSSTELCSLDMPIPPPPPPPPPLAPPPPPPPPPPTSIALPQVRQKDASLSLLLSHAVVEIHFCPAH